MDKLRRKLDGPSMARPFSSALWCRLVVLVCLAALLAPVNCQDLQHAVHASPDNHHQHPHPHQQPVSWGFGLGSLIQDIVLDRVDRAKLLSQDAEEQRQLLLAQQGTGNSTHSNSNTNTKWPYRWGHSPEVSAFPGISMRYSGNWTQLNDKEWIWRLSISSPEAISQQVIFSTLWLPAGSRMWIYSQESHERKECNADCYLFTAHDTRIDEKFTTPIIHGPRVYLEYHIRLPDNPLDTIVPRIHVFKVVQGYRDVLLVHEKAAGTTQPTDHEDVHVDGVGVGVEDHVDLTPKGIYGLSQSCNNDATCPLLGDEWEQARHSVVQILTDGGSSGNQFSAVCTGTLINNVNKKSYVLTAYHCLEGESVANWAFVFNYERDCNAQQIQRSKFKDFLNGAKLVWADKASDVILLEIYQDVPRHYNAYFAGWDASAFDFLDPYSVAFHHPSGDFKKVSVDSNAKGEGSCPFCGNLEKSHIVVTGWDDGTTERGSSGCSLFNSDQKVVGILSGGSASCPDGEGFDLFGKLEVAFRHGLGKHLSGGGEALTMEGEWNVDPNSAVMFQPQSLVVAENGPEKAFHIWLSESVERDAVVSVSLSVPEGVSHLVESLSPREIHFTSEDWFKQKEIVIKPKDNKDFDGDVKYYLQLHVQHNGGNGGGPGDLSSYMSQYPVIHQDDEHISGDTLFDPIEIDSLPFSFMGDTSSGYTNTYQSRCELGSASPDVVFEFSPKEDVYVSISLCSLLLFDSTLYVMENGQEKWCNDDGGQCAPSSELLNLLFQQGKTYHIVVDGYNGAQGRFQLEMNEVPQYVNSFEGADQYAYDTAVPLDTFAPTPPSGDALSGGSATALPMDTFSVPRDTYRLEGGESYTAGGLAPIAKLKSDKEPEKASDDENAALPSGVPLRSILTFYNVLESTKTEDSFEDGLRKVSALSSSSASAPTHAVNLAVKMTTFLGAFLLTLL